MRTPDAYLTCRSCQRRRRESDFTTAGMVCADCAERAEWRKQQILEMRLAAQHGRTRVRAFGPADILNEERRDARKR
jgi:hypothetical protein